MVLLYTYHSFKVVGCMQQDVISTFPVQCNNVLFNFLTGWHEIHQRLPSSFVLNNLPGEIAGSRSRDHGACRCMRCVVCSLVEVYPLIYPNHACSKIPQNVSIFRYKFHTA